MQGHFRFFAMVFFNSHVGLGVIWYFNIYKLIKNCKGWWRVHNRRQQVGVARALMVVPAASTHRRIPQSRAASMHLTTSITVVRRMFSDGTRRSSDKEFFSSSLFFLSPSRKPCWPLQKKKRKKEEESLAICLLS
jgi:hypothetical protein